MGKSFRIFLALTYLSVAFNAKSQQSLPYGDNPAVGKYFLSNGVNIYYEIYGKGKPLVLLHGNGGSIKSRGRLISGLAKKYKVIAIDNRCHGKSGCMKGDLDYDMMASDVFGLLEAIDVDSAFVWGHSDGGIIGLIMASLYPEKVDRLLCTGANIAPDTSAIQPELVEMMKMYPKVHDTLLQKQIKLMVHHPNISTIQLASINAPVLLMAGDRDAIRNEHTVKIFNAIPNSQLCIVPGSTHYFYEEQPDLFTLHFNRFFEQPFTVPSTVEIMRKIADTLLNK